MMNVVSVIEFFEAINVPLVNNEIWIDILEISETWWMHWKQWDF